MNSTLNNLLPYLDYSSFSYNPTVGKEKTCLDLYYRHKMYAGRIGVDNDKLYLSIRAEFYTEYLEDSFPEYHDDLDKFLNRFNLKPLLKFSEWNDEYTQVYELLSVKKTLSTYVDALSKYLYTKPTASAEKYIEIVRRIIDEFG